MQREYNKILMTNKNMEHNTAPRSLVTFGLIMGISLVLVALIVGWVAYYVKTYNNSIITVDGVAEKEVQSDAVKWQGDLTVNTGPTTADLKAGSAQMQSNLSALQAYFTANGASATDITVDPLSISPEYQNQNGVPYPAQKMAFAGNGNGSALVGYALSQHVMINSANVAGITALAQKAPQYLLNNGVVFTSQPIEYYISTATLNALRQQMLATALANAKDRAQAITEGVGAHVGNLRSSSIGVTQITPVNSTEISSYGYYDTTAMEKMVTYIVHTTFSMR